MIPPSFLEVTTEKLLHVVISFSGYTCLGLDDYSEYHKNLIQLLFIIFLLSLFLRLLLTRISFGSDHKLVFK